MNRLMMLLAAGFAALGAWASTYTVGGYTWTYFTVNTDAGQVAMIGNGSSCAATPKPTGALTLPSKMGTYPVGRIAGNAFRGCTGLTDVTIPSGVTDIAVSAFDGCSAMKTVSIPESVTLIDNYAFANCTSLASVAIPSGVTNLRQGADVSDLWTVQYVFFIDAHPFFVLDGANYIRCLILFDARQHPVLRMGFLRGNHAAIENSYRVWFTAS